MDALPIFLDLRGRPVALVGSGPVADAKRQLLESAGACVAAIDATALQAPLPDIRLAVVAVDDDGLAQGWVARLRDAGVLVNAVDRPRLCDFTLPAIIDRSPVVVAIGTGGASASLAKALRERLEGWLPPVLGTIALAIRATRESVNARLPTPAQRRGFWDRLLAPGGALDPLRETTSDPSAIIRSALDGQQPLHTPTTLYLTSEDPEELTVRTLRLMQTADVILADDSVSEAILARARRDARIIRGDSVPDGLPEGSIILRISADR